VTELAASDHVKGPRDAVITIIEYSDFDCPFCSRFHDSMNELVAARRYCLVVSTFPLRAITP